ncbi:MAG: hypothetical protein RL367_2615, partial [Pseudomonadota bacterium]
MAERERLAAWLKEHKAFGPATEITTFAPLSGGQSSVLFRLECTGCGPFVIRMEPRGRQIFLAPDIVREYRIAEGLAAAGVAIAPLIAVESDETILGAPFMVMGEVAGTAPLGRPSMHGSGLLPDLDAAQRSRLSDAAIDTLAKIHAVDWRATHPFLAGEIAREGGLVHHLDHLTRWYQWTVQGRTFP